MDEGWDGAIQPDALVEILLRIPPSARRRLRLVCRHWRDVADERLPARRRVQSKVLAYVTDHYYPCPNPLAYVFDDLTEGRSRELDLRGSDEGSGVYMVGTCNGLICLHGYSDRKITLFNPITGEKLVVEPPPPVVQHQFRCSFTYHPATGLYKIVLVAYEQFDAVEVFTLGGASWRKVPSPGSGGCITFGLVSIDGVMYWVTKDDVMSVMSLDLKDERVAFVTTLPVPVLFLEGNGSIDTWDLTDVGGRLGFVCCPCKPMTTPAEASTHMTPRPRFCPHADMMYMRCK
ncbi:hypothetical protein EJB05_48565, partial [Eragrostis curvula]